jgi:cytochrome c oxidase subunit 3
VSEYAVSYVAEEHAPDPVHSRGDPALPGKIAIWLFLASEVMFFVAILGSYVIFRSGSPNLFAKHAATLSKVPATINTVLLLTSALLMAFAVVASQRGDPKRVAKFLALTLLCAAGFIGVKLYEYKGKFEHYTFQYLESPGQVMVYDGHVKKGLDGWTVSHAVRTPLPQTTTFDLRLVTDADVRQGFADASGSRTPGEELKDPVKIDPAKVTNAMSYGPWKNVFFSSYYTLTFVHVLHVVGGMVPLVFLLGHALRGKVFPRHAEYTGLYWSFVDLVWIFLFPLLYLI